MELVLRRGVRVIDGRNGAKDVRREREVAREKVEGTDEGLGVVDGWRWWLLLLQGSHNHGGSNGPLFVS